MGNRNVGWRVTFEVVDTLTGSSSLAGRPFEEQPHELYRKWKVYTGNGIFILIIYIFVSGPLRGLLEEIQQIPLIHLQSKPPSHQTNSPNQSQLTKLTQPDLSPSTHPTQ